MECSTLDTKKPQIGKNLRKAMDDRRRCLFAVASMDAAERLVEAVRELVPDAKLGREFSVLYLVEGRFCVIPRGMSQDGFPFIPPPERTTPPASDETVVKEVLTALLSEGKTKVKGGEIMERIPQGELRRFT